MSGRMEGVESDTTSDAAGTGVNDACNAEDGGDKVVTEVFTGIAVKDFAPSAVESRHATDEEFDAGHHQRRSDEILPLCRVGLWKDFLDFVKCTEVQGGSFVEESFVLVLGTDETSCQCFYCGIKNRRPPYPLRNKGPPASILAARIEWLIRRIVKVDPAVIELEEELH